MVPPARAPAATTTDSYSPSRFKKATTTYSPHINIYLKKLGKYVAPLIILATDYIAVILALIVAWYMRANILPLVFPVLTSLSIESIYIFYAIPLCYVCFLAYEGMYSRRLLLWQDAEYLFKIATYVTGLIISVTYFIGEAASFSRIFIFATSIFSFLFLLLSRYCTKRALFLCGLWQKPVVVVGAGKTAELLVKSFKDDPYIGYRIVGLIEDNYRERPLAHQLPHIGVFAQAEQAIKSSGVEDVIIAAPGLERERLLELVYRVQPCVKYLSVVPDLLGLPLGNITVEPLFNEKVLLLKTKNNLMSLPNRVIKRLFDVILGVAILPVILPILLLIAIMIKLGSPGPILHIARRLGKNGREFYCYKFRSMHQNPDAILEKYLNENPTAKREWETYAKLKEYDPRVTRFGSVIRRYSLDELPQIINVIMGDMSLVGPRPYLPREKVSIGSYLGTIIGSLPGITGLWQVSGRNDISFEGRLILDCWYVRNWSVWLDIVLLCRTIKVVFGKNGAY